VDDVAASADCQAIALAQLQLQGYRGVFVYAAAVSDGHCIESGFGTVHASQILHRNNRFSQAADTP
jgi:hypothetical protein